MSDQRQAADSLVEVRVEIPRGSRNKYEYDPDRQMFRLDRRLFSATVYPADYGFINGHRLLPVCFPTALTFGTTI